MPFRLNEVSTPCGLSWMNCSIWGASGASIGMGVLLHGRGAMVCTGCDFSVTQRRLQCTWGSPYSYHREALFKAMRGNYVQPAPRWLKLTPGAIRQPRDLNQATQHYTLGTISVCNISVPGDIEHITPGGVI